MPSFVIFESPKKEGCSIHRKSTDDASYIDHFSDLMTDHQESMILQQAFDAEATATLTNPYSFVGMTMRPQADLLRGNNLRVHRSLSIQLASRIEHFYKKGNPTL